MDKLQEAIRKEISYIKELTGSGMVVGLGEKAKPVGSQPISEAEIISRKDAVNKKYLGF